MNIGTKLKNKVIDIEKKKISDAENELLKAKQIQHDIDNRLNKIIDKIKLNLELISNDILQVILIEGLFVKVTDTKDVFGDYIYHSNTYTRESIDFFEFYKNNNKVELLNEFKIWLDNNGIESLVLRWDHDGYGVNGWVNYCVKLK